MTDLVAQRERARAFRERLASEPEGDAGPPSEHGTDLEFVCGIRDCLGLDPRPSLFLKRK